MAHENNLWNELKEEITKSDRNIIIYEAEEEIAQNTLEMLTMTKNSAIGSITYNTSGIVIDNWIRVLGSGDGIERRNIFSWYDENEAIKEKGLLIIADDIIGGIFALNMGKYEGEVGGIFYFAPDSLNWENLEVKYDDFFTWLTEGDLEQFYSSVRWENWEEEVQSVGFDQALLIYPFLWTNECNINTASKKALPIKEVMYLYLEQSEL